MKRTELRRRTPFTVPLNEDGSPRWSSFTHRTGIQASPWSRTVPLLGTGNKSAATRTRRETGFPRSVRLAVRKRAGGGDIEQAACEACGRWLGRYRGEVQHRAARGSGGCRDEVIQGISNAVLLCGSGSLRTGCHGACENRKAHMAMDAGGFWIEHGTTPAYDPRNVPILLASPHGSGMTVWLAADGKGPDGTGYLKQRPEARAA